MEKHISFLHKYNNKVFLIDEIAIMETDIDREILLRSDYYLDYNLNKYNGDVTYCNKYRITERIIDKNKNLLVKMEKE